MGFYVRGGVDSWDDYAEPSEDSTKARSSRDNQAMPLALKYRCP